MSSKPAQNEIFPTFDAAALFEVLCATFLVTVLVESIYLNQWIGISTRLRDSGLAEARTLPEVAMIKKVAGGYKVLSEKGKNLGGPYKTKAEAEKRLRQVEYFKHKK